MTDIFPEPGDLFVDRYRVDALLNRGGFGRVYKATQIELKRSVAIKILQPATRVGFNDDAEAEDRRLRIVAKRFEREAQLVSQLRDPNTVMMYDYGTTPAGLLYMVLEYVDGDPLDKVIGDSGPISPKRVVKIARQILSSLHEAHTFGMLHRDIKPANIMLFDHIGRRDQVKVLDFGLAKSIDDPKFNADDPDLTDSEVLIGTPRYMSPEQIRGDKLGPATDMYSLGLVLFEMLTGHKAVLAKSTMNTLARHINDVPIVLPASLEIPDGLRDAVNQMLEKRSDKRVDSAESVLEALETWDVDLPMVSFEPNRSAPPELPNVLVLADADLEELAFEDPGPFDSSGSIEGFFRAEPEPALLQPIQEKKTLLVFAALVAVFLLVFGALGLLSTDKNEEAPDVKSAAALSDTNQPPDIPIVVVEPKVEDMGLLAAQDGTEPDMSFEAENDAPAVEEEPEAKTKTKRRKKAKKKKPKPFIRTLK